MTHTLACRSPKLSSTSGTFLDASSYFTLFVKSVECSLEPYCALQTQAVSKVSHQPGLGSRFSISMQIFLFLLFPGQNMPMTIWWSPGRLIWVNFASRTPWAVFFPIQGSKFLISIFQFAFFGSKLFQDFKIHIQMLAILNWVNFGWEGLVNHSGVLNFYFCPHAKFLDFTVLCNHNVFASGIES